jgi:hypothetical protein
MMAFEYAPQGIATKVTNSVTKIDITKDQIAKSSYTVIKGKEQVKEEEIKPHYKKFSINGNGGILRINQFSYPGWKVFIDNNEVSYRDNNRLKLIEFDVPSGNHSIEARFIDTPARTIGNILSAASIVGILLYIILVSAIKINYGKSKKSKNK